MKSKMERTGSWAARWRRGISCLGIYLAALTCAGAFTEWEVSTLAANLSFRDYGSPQASDSSDDGRLHTVFVVNDGSRDQLCYLGKDVYAPPPSGLTIAPFPITIDSADKIASLAVLHDQFSGKVHVAYATVKSVTIPAVGTLTTSAVRHAVLTLGTPPQIEITTVASFNNIPTITSLSLGFSSTGRRSYPAVSYYDLIFKRLTYAAQLSDNSWSLETVEDNGASGDVGKNSSLVFDADGRARVAYEDAGNSRIRIATRPGPGDWDLATVADAPAGGTVTSPALTMGWLAPEVPYVAYARRSGNTESLMLGTGIIFGFTAEVVDSVTTPSGGIFRPTIANPSLVDSIGRFVISYTRSPPGSPFLLQPWVAVRRSVDNTFSTTLLPRLAGSESTSAGTTSLSLDGHDYPIVTWNPNGGGAVRAAYSLDMTDRDGDGVPHLHERAFRSDPYNPDRQLRPNVRVLKNQVGEPTETQFVALVFLVMGDTGILDGTIEPDETITSGLFSYRPQYTTDGITWVSDPAKFKSSVSISFLQNPPPPNGPSGSVRSRIPLGTPGTPREWLRLQIFRL